MDSNDIKLPGLPKDTMVAMLASDLASELIDARQVLIKYQLTSVQLRKIIRSKEFRRLYFEAKQQWDSATNTEERIRSKSKMLVEDSLTEVFGIIHDPETSPSSKIEGFKNLVQVADLGPKKDTKTTGERVSITINVPAMPDQPGKSITLSGEVLEHDNSETGGSDLPRTEQGILSGVG